MTSPGALPERHDVEPIRLVIADPHAIVRDGLCALFAHAPGIEVVAEAADAESLVARMPGLDARIVVLDLALPGGGGMSLIPRIRAAARDAAVIVLSRLNDPRLVGDALAAGGAAYVLMQSGFGTLEQAVHAIARGEHFLDPALDGVCDSDPTPSRRELDVLQRAALGHSNKAIAVSLGISPRTVEAHKTHAMRKLGLHGRDELMRYAATRQWLGDHASLWPAEAPAASVNARGSRA